VKSKQTFCLVGLSSIRARNFIVSAVVTGWGSRKKASCYPCYEG